MDTEKIKEILKRNNIQDAVSEVIIKESELKGESLGSATSSATIKFENPLLAPLHLFIKQLPEDQAHSAMITESKQFKKEAMFFTEYLPEIEKLCKKSGNQILMEIYPKCYYGDEQLIVLENLVLDKGFVLLEKEKMQDFYAAQFALTTLAKHHAISYCYVKDIGGSQQFLKRFEDFNFLSYDAEKMRAMMVPFVDDPVALSIKILSMSKNEDKDKAIEILKTYQVNTYDKFMAPLRRKFDDDDNTIRVINHGDYWNGNMMFLKNKLNGEKIDKHVIIDFAVLNFNTPAVDIAFYILTTVRPAVWQRKFQELLEVYRNAFVKTTEDLGYPVEMSYEDLLRDFRETFVHGFLLGLGFCTGIGTAVMADADPGSNGGFDEWAGNYTKLVEKWMADNPEKNEESAKILISVVELHEKLKMA